MTRAVTRAAIAAVTLGTTLLVSSLHAHGQPIQSVLAKARAERDPLIDTMRQLVSIESGSRNFVGLTRIATVIADRLRDLGGEVELVEPADIYYMQDTPDRIGNSVLARFRGTGTMRILLLAHMDTVYLPGMLEQQPFRLDGDRAYGLGIADDKHGVAVVLHTLGVLQALDFDDYGLLTVLINADEEVSSAGSRSIITALGREHDAVFSCEGSSGHRVRLRTSGIGAFDLVFERRRPPLVVNQASGRLAVHAQEVYRELGMRLTVDEEASGGGTDAAFAALETDAPVIEGMGLQGFGAHSNQAEYVNLESIEPRLYLLARLIMDLSEGKHR